MMRIAEVRRHCLGLPEAAEAPHFNYASFRVAGKIFVTVPPEETHIHVFVPEARREPALAMDPEWLEPLHWGVKIVGLRATLAGAKPAVLRDLIDAAWAARAPKRLVAGKSG